MICYCGTAIYFFCTYLFYVDEWLCNYLWMYCIWIQFVDSCFQGEWFCIKCEYCNIFAFIWYRKVFSIPYFYYIFADIMLLHFIISWWNESMYVWHFMIFLVKQNKAPDRKVHGANIGPTWVLLAPDEPHVVRMNLAMKGTLYIMPNLPISHGSMQFLPISIGCVISLLVYEENENRLLDFSGEGKHGIIYHTS